MTRSLLLRSFIAIAAMAAGETALAQSAQCQHYRAELAALDRGGGNPASSSAERQRAEIGRLVSYYRSIGCERVAPFGGLFGNSVPAECGSISQRIRQMEANYDRLRAQVDVMGGSDARRRQLIAAIEQTCNAPQQEALRGPRSFFESLFGPPRDARPADPLQGQPPLPGEDEERAYGGSRLVCVRTCDGFAFPLGSSPGGRGNADEMCQALCPGAETAAFSASYSDDALERAISLKGKPYHSLPGAFKFQKSFEASCTCKKDGERWAQVLSRAESLLGQQRGDILVTAQKAEELSRAKPPAPPAPTARKPDPKRPATDAAEAQAAAEAGAAAPTASQESAGIGPKAIDAGQVVAKGEGQSREIVTGDGTRRVVRVVAPHLIPVPVPEQRAP